MQNARELLCFWKIQLCWFRIPLSNQINAESALFMSLAFTWSEKSHIFLFWPFLTKDILLLNEKLFSESFRSCTSSWFFTICVRPDSGHQRCDDLLENLTIISAWPLFQFHVGQICFHLQYFQCDLFMIQKLLWS